MFRDILDVAQYVVSEFLYKNLYGTDTGNPEDDTEDRKNLRIVLPAAAVQYFFDLLFPGNYEAEDCLCGICGARPGDQRSPDHGTSGCGRKFISVVCNADYRMSGHDLCGDKDEKLYERAIKKQL